MKTLLLTIKWLRIFRSLKLSYLAAVLSQIRPVLCVTWFDNNELFHNLSNVLEDIKFVAIQNSWRYPSSVIHPFTPKRAYRSDLLCFGAIDLEGLAHDDVRFERQKIIGNTKSHQIELQESQGAYDLIWVSKGMTPELVAQIAFKLNNLDKYREKAFSRAYAFVDLSLTSRYDERDLRVKKNVAPLSEEYAFVTACFIKFARESNMRCAVLSKGAISRTYNPLELDFWTRAGIALGASQENSQNSKVVFPDARLYLGHESTLLLDLLGVSTRVSIVRCKGAAPLVPLHAEVNFWSITNYIEFYQGLVDYFAGNELARITVKDSQAWISETHCDTSSPYSRIRTHLANVLWEYEE
jgi:hypothetical protein